MKQTTDFPTALYWFFIFCLLAVATWFAFRTTTGGEPTTVHCFGWDCAA